MRRQAVVAFAVFAAFLAATAMPVAAVNTNQAVGSAHTNATDFNAATELTNVTVEGSGTAANVELDTVAAFTDSFENQPADAGAPDGWTEESSGGSVSVTTARASDGSQSVAVSDADAGLERITTPVASTTGDISFSVWQNAGGTNQQARLFESDTRVIIVGMRNGDLAYFDGSWNTISTTPGTGEWVNVTISNIDTSANTFSVTWEAGADSGTTDSLDMENGMSAGYDEIGLVADDSDGNFDDIAAGSQPADSGTYISQTHSVDNASTGWTNVTLTNASAEVTWLADTNGDGTFETTAGSSTFTTTANHTIDVSATDSTDWRVNVTFINQTTNGVPTAQLHDEGLLFTNHEPRIDNSSGAPTGQLTSGTQSLSIDVNDTEFGTAQGDSVGVEFFVDGSPVGTDTITANGTASVSHTFSGGSHTWSATATDEYGLSNASQTFSVSTPGNVTIREEQEPHAIVDQATATVVISGSDETVDRQTVTDGNVSLAGLPTDQDYAVVVNASGYHPRTILVEDVFSQSDVFVLNESRASVQNTFVIEDRTGNFPPGETNLLIEKAINRSKYDSSHSDGYQWLVISGDRLGADQSLVVDLEQDGRYRLVAENQDSDRRVLGEYSAASAGVVELRIGNVEVTPDDSGTYAWSADYTNSSGTKFVKFQFNDPDVETADLRLVIHEFGNESNEIENSTHSGPFGTFSFTEDLSAIGTDAEETDWVVEFTATRDGEEITGSAVVGRDTIGTGVPVAPMWLHVGSVGLLILISGLVGGLVNPGAAAATVASVAGVLWYMGMLPAAIGGGAIALALLVSAGWILATQGGSFR